MDIQTIVIDLLGQIFSKELAITMVLTFCICEAIFAFESDKPSKKWSSMLKQGISIITGLCIGMIIIPSQDTVPGWIIGAVGGGLLTLGVAKFKKPAEPKDA